MDRFWNFIGAALRWGVSALFALAAGGAYSEHPSSAAFIPLIIVALALRPPVRRSTSGPPRPIRTMFIVLGALIGFGVLSEPPKSKDAAVIADETQRETATTELQSDQDKIATSPATSPWQPISGSAKVCLTDSDINLGAAGEIMLPASTVFRDSGVLSGNKEAPATWDDDHQHPIGAGSAIITLTPIALSQKQRCSAATVKMFLGPLYNERRAFASDNHVFSIEDVLDYPVPAQKPPVEIGRLIDDISVRAVLLTDVNEAFAANAASSDKKSEKLECLEGAQKLAVHVHAALGREYGSAFEIANTPASNVTYGCARSRPSGPDLSVDWEKSASPSAATLSFIASAGDFLTGDPVSELKQELMECVTEALKPKSGELANREFRGVRMECQAFSRDGGGGSVTIYRRFGPYPVRLALTENERVALMHVSEAGKAKAVFASQAAVDELPRFDVAALCREAASIGGNYSASSESGCFNLEQSAYDELKLRWDDTPRNTRKLCTEAAQSGGAGSYTSLLGCLDLEKRARDEMVDRRFKY